jgi:hypothetical protein
MLASLFTGNIFFHIEYITFHFAEYFDSYSHLLGKIHPGGSEVAHSLPER